MISSVSLKAESSLRKKEVPYLLWCFYPSVTSILCVAREDGCSVNRAELQTRNITAWKRGVNFQITCSWYIIIYCISSSVMFLIPGKFRLPSSIFHGGLALHDTRLCDVDFNFHTQLYQVSVFADKWHDAAALRSAFVLLQVHSDTSSPTSKRPPRGCPPSRLSGQIRVPEIEKVKKNGNTQKYSKQQHSLCSPLLLCISQPREVSNYDALEGMTVLGFLSIQGSGSVSQ